MSRFTLSEIASTVIRAGFTTGDTVTVTIYNNASSTPVALDSNACIEIGSTGYFVFGLSNITTPPTTYADLFWVMTNSTTEVTGNMIFGGSIEDTVRLSGANVVTLTIEETDETPIAAAEIQLWNSGQTLLLDTKTTNSSGQVVFSADDGSYKVVASKPQVSFTVPEDLTVSGTTAQTYNGTPNVITPGSGAGECEVSIFASSQAPSSYLSSLKGTAQIKQLPTSVSGVYYSGQKITGTYDSTTGRLYWLLPRTAVVSFVVDGLGISSEKTIPSQASADYTDL